MKIILIESKIYEISDMTHSKLMLEASNSNERKDAMLEEIEDTHEVKMIIDIAYNY